MPASFPLRHAAWAAGVALALTVAWWWLRPLTPPRDRLVCLNPAGLALAANNVRAGMAWVEGGSFDLGDEVYPEEKPRRRVSVGGFWIDRTEVTNDQFAAFVTATGYVTEAERPLDAARHPMLPPEMLVPGALVFTPPREPLRGLDATQWWRYVPGANWRRPGGPGTSIEGRGSFPVVAVTHADALAYARWKGRGLPTEAQWEWAARGGRPAQGGSAAHSAGTGAAAAAVPPVPANTWQGLFPVADTADDGFAGLAPVGCFAPNALGLHDMIGNAWELTDDVWTADHAAASAELATVARSAAATQQHVIKGGSYLCAANYCRRYRAGARQPQDDGLAAGHVGFRTVLLAPGP